MGPRIWGSSAEAPGVVGTGPGRALRRRRWPDGGNERPEQGPRLPSGWEQGWGSYKEPEKRALCEFSCSSGSRITDCVPKLGEPDRPWCGDTHADTCARRTVGPQ